MVPSIVAELGEEAAKRFVEFFTANIGNKNTRAAYAQAVASSSLGAKATTLRLST
jgi:hypothetical protein